jgi:hypothetical protein
MPLVKTYALGDLHGMAGLLRAALAFIAADARDEAAQVVFLGDYLLTVGQIRKECSTSLSPGHRTRCTPGSR